VRGLPPQNDPNLIVGFDSFSDAGVYRLRDDLYLVQTVDFFPPLVDDPFTFGQIAAANALSDALAMGAEPKTALNIAAFPDDQLELTVLEQILAGGAERVAEAGAVIVGGHTVRDAEIKYGLAVTGIVGPDTLITNSRAQPGDALVLTKALGTGFITTAAKAELCPEPALAAATRSMVQLNTIGRDAARAAGAHAATDVTGFGLAGHALEMAQASHVTVCLTVDSLPELPHALEMASRGFTTRASRSNREYAAPSLRVEAGTDSQRLELAFDPQTSGGLLIAVPRHLAPRLVEHARRAGAQQAAIVGHVLERREVAVIFQP